METIPLFTPSVTGTPCPFRHRRARACLRNASAAEPSMSPSLRRHLTYPAPGRQLSPARRQGRTHAAHISLSSMPTGPPPPLCRRCRKIDVQHDGRTLLQPISLRLEAIRHTQVDRRRYQFSPLLASWGKLHAARRLHACLNHPHC